MPTLPTTPPLVDRLRSLPFATGGNWNGIPAAVLLAFSPLGDGVDDCSLVLVRRPASMRQHAGQIGFPGGGVEPTDADGIAAALREAHEEVGIDPAAVEVLGALGRVPVVVSGFDVLLVVGLWDGDAPLRPNPAEVDGVLRPSVRQLTDPANHGLVPIGDVVGPEAVAARGIPPDARTPVFRVGDQVVWGFTAGVLSAVLDELGLPCPALPPGWPRPRATAGP